MTRKLPEWIGKTDDTKPPPRVRLRVFDHHMGICHLSGIKIMPGDVWECDHIIALINGGENRESNLAPALKAKHRIKTDRDVAEKAAIAKKRAKHIGAVAPKQKIRSPGFTKREPKPRRPSLPYRSLYTQ